MNIQTHANQQDKLPKKIVQHNLEAMYADPDFAKHKGVLAELYKYFIPNLPAKAKTHSEWVNKAVGKPTGDNAGRKHLHHNYSDGVNLVATDGHRMHMCNTDLRRGFYDAWDNKIEVQETFPEYKRIIPAKMNEFTLIVSDLEVHVRGFKDMLYYGIQGMLFVKKFIDEAMNKHQQCTAYISKGVLLLEVTSDCTAIIMQTANTDDNRFK